MTRSNRAFGAPLRGRPAARGIVLDDGDAGQIGPRKALLRGRFERRIDALALDRLRGNVLGRERIGGQLGERGLFRPGSPRHPPPDPPLHTPPPPPPTHLPPPPHP